MDRAAELIASGGVLAALRMAMECRTTLAEGRYCECEQPSLVDDALMCGSCLLRNRDQEITRIHRSVDPHGHVPDELGGRMCAVCTMWPDDPRHHGQPAVGRTSWGDTVWGVR